ncbi:hypothetical protein THF1C08_210099 [Vibrio jasicida]|uniref:Uncharacterized protein n=1 Tax=Vibrio jasicida TaxID=766224 RepID=A0AAU9QKU6_9VIBR|nr:hypothetical protein THF1C08_210099 [Vibrio jasicida]CAH1590671.1 hypothetical protein THF1A12_220098 [Vibrio jasicida]
MLAISHHHSELCYQSVIVAVLSPNLTLSGDIQFKLTPQIFCVKKKQKR